MMKSTLIAAQQIEAKQLHIASIVVHVRPDHFIDLKQWLLPQKGVEIHAENAQGKLVLVTETEQEQAILDLIDQIAVHPGTLNAALVYHEIISAQDIAADEKLGLPAVDIKEPTT